MKQKAPPRPVAKAFTLAREAMQPSLLNDIRRLQPDGSYGSAEIVCLVHWGPQPVT